MHWKEVFLSDSLAYNSNRNAAVVTHPLPPPYLLETKADYSFLSSTSLSKTSETKLTASVLSQDQSAHKVK